MMWGDGSGGDADSLLSDENMADQFSGLAWSNTYSPANWYSAEATCLALGDGWRLTSIADLGIGYLAKQNQETAIFLEAYYWTFD